LEWSNFDASPILEQGAEDESGISDIDISGPCPDPKGKLFLPVKLMLRFVEGCTAINNVLAWLSAIVCMRKSARARERKSARA
jgi:hypothetical protein